MKKTLNHVIALSIIILAFIVLSLSISAQENITATVSKIVNGSVFYKCEKETDGEWKRARVGAVIYEKCFFSTTESAKAVLNFTPDVTLEIIESSELYIGKVNAEVVELTLKNGSLISDLAPLRKLIKEYKINTVSSTAGARGTKFLVDTNVDINTFVVSEGSVALENNLNKNYKVDVKSGKAVRSSPLGKPSDPKDVSKDILKIFDNVGKDVDWDFYEEWENFWDEWDDMWDEWEDMMDSMFDDDEFEDFWEDMVENDIWNGDDWEDDLYDDDWDDDDDWWNDDWDDDDWGDGYNDWDDWNDGNWDDGDDDSGWNNDDGDDWNNDDGGWNNDDGGWNNDDGGWNDDEGNDWYDN